MRPAVLESDLSISRIRYATSSRSSSQKYYTKSDLKHSTEALCDGELAIKWWDSVLNHLEWCVMTMILLKETIQFCYSKGRSEILKLNLKEWLFDLDQRRLLDHYHYVHHWCILKKMLIIMKCRYYISEIPRKLLRFLAGHTRSQQQPHKIAWRQKSVRLNTKTLQTLASYLLIYYMIILVWLSSKLLNACNFQLDASIVC
jgi:hypothetical protein